MRWNGRRSTLTVLALMIAVPGAVAQVASRGAVASIKVEDPKAPKPPARAAQAHLSDGLIAATIGPPPIPYRSNTPLEHWYEERGNVAFPTTEKLTFCHAYGCALRATVRITDDDYATLKSQFASHSPSAATEREAVNRAVSWFEKRAQPLLGGPPDVRGSDFAHSGQAGQTDCLDEATNTTTMLVFLQKAGFLRYHRVLRPTSRGGLLLGLAHATAVLSDRGGQEWAIDSWMRDMGDPNDIMPLPDWEGRLF